MSKRNYVITGCLLSPHILTMLPTLSLRTVATRVDTNGFKHRTEEAEDEGLQDSDCAEA